MDDSARGSHDTVIGAGPDTITLLNTTANDFGANDFLF
jgi:hypothetical protein